MCGIMYCKRLDGKDCKKMALKRYQYQKSRGQEGFGFVLLDKGRVVKYDRSETEKEILERLNQLSGDEMMFHHRFPTSTANVFEAAHPIRVSNSNLKYDYYLVHNGIISGTDKWKEYHESIGFRYTTEILKQVKTKERLVTLDCDYNDSEVLAIEMAIAADTGKDGITLNGSIAFVMLQVKKHSTKAVRLFWGRNSGSPLKYCELDGIFRTITSEGQGEVVTPHKLYEIDYATNAVSCRDFTVGLSDSYQSDQKRIGFEYIPPSLESKTISFDNNTEEYYDLVLKYDNLRKRFEQYTDAGIDSVALGQELDDVEAQLADMEASMSQQELSEALNIAS